MDNDLFECLFVCRGFVAQKLRLPLAPPYFRDANCSNCRKFRKGVNFAVVGATALDNAYLARKGIINELTNVSLGVQLGLLRTLLPSLCSSSSGKYPQMLLFLPNNQKCTIVFNYKRQTGQEFMNCHNCLVIRRRFFY